MPIRKTPETKFHSKDRIPMEFTITEPVFSFEDLILDDETLEDISDSLSIIEYGNLIFDKWGLGKVIKQNRNVSINLYGPSGTGKTATAHAIAKKLEKRILLVNYAEIESKYVGETSKNLVNMFEFAKERDVVIAFDEADALLSKRVTSMHSSTDVSVNQTRNVLLKILDSYTGVIVFTTNFIRNYDKAFMRRITSHIKIDLPSEQQRMQLWDHYIVPTLPLSGNREEILSELKKREGITGADIANTVLKAAVLAAKMDSKLMEPQFFISQLDKIIEAKKAVNGNVGEFGSDYKVETRKVSKEYVEEQYRKGDMINGITDI